MWHIKIGTSIIKVFPTVWTKCFKCINSLNWQFLQKSSHYTWLCAEMSAQCIFLLLWDPPRSPGRGDSPRTYSLSHCRYVAAVPGMILTSGGETMELHQCEPWHPFNNIFTVAQRVVASYLIPRLFSSQSNQIFALCTFFTEMHFFRTTVCHCRNMQTNSLASLEVDTQ